MVSGCSLNQTRDWMLHDRSLATVYDNTDRKSDEKNDEGSRLVSAQSHRRSRSHTTFNVGVSDEMQDESDGKQGQAKH